MVHIINKNLIAATKDFCIYSYVRITHACHSLNGQHASLEKSILCRAAIFRQSNKSRAYAIVGRVISVHQI